jgi:hypothetical protein
MNKERDIYQRVHALLEQTQVGSDWLEIAADFNELDVYLAGGSLRDLFLERDVGPKDLDFFLGGSGTEEVFTRLAANGTVRYGPFGSPRWFPTRAACAYCDVIPIRAFSNGLWRCDDILDVLNQFDFTGNALALHLRTGVLYDPQNGIRDLRLRVMRAIRFDYPDEPFSASSKLTRPAVVWFRILHYAAALGLTLEPVTRAWIYRNSAFADQSGDFAATFFPLHPEALSALQGPS